MKFKTSVYDLLSENHTMDDGDETTPPPSPALQNSTENSGAQTMGLCYDGNLTFPRQQHISDYGHSIGSSGSSRRYDLPALITEGESMVYGIRPGNNEGASCSESHLSEIMPDVAMATASLGHLQLNEPPESLQLDLGDGSSHGIIGAAGVGMQVNPFNSLFKAFYTNTLLMKPNLYLSSILTF